MSYAVEMPMSLRPMRLQDIPAGLHLCRLSGWNQVDEDWRAFLESPAGGGWVVEEAGAVLGTVTFLRYDEAFAWLAMMLVDPACRRSGIGTQLMDAALESLAGDACVRLDASRDGEPLYRRFGFVTEFELERASVVAGPEFPPPLQASDAAVRPMQEDELPKVFSWDRMVFGAGREALLASFRRRAPQLAWTAWDGGGLAGYTFGRPGHLYPQLGPVSATNEAVARDLVATCLSGQTGRIAADVPVGKRGWVEWLRAAGFRTERPFLRMRRGRCTSRPGAGYIRPGLSPEREFAIAGPEFG